MSWGANFTILVTTVLDRSCWTLVHRVSSVLVRLSGDPDIELNIHAMRYRISRAAEQCR